MPGKQLKTTKIEMDNNERGKKLPTPLPSSYTFAPRWMAKSGSESRPTSPTNTSAVSDENFPSLANSGDEVKKKRSVWNDPNIVKRKVISASLPGGEDPFAGMNTRVDYQQEIERLKALVPKVEKKIKIATRPKSMGSDLKQPQRLWPDNTTAIATATTTTTTTTTTTSTPVARSASTKTSTFTTRFVGDELESVNTVVGDAVTRANGSPGSTNTPFLTTAVSTPAVDMSTSSADEEEEEEEENPSGPVITEEEKLRFLEFMRSWTGCWQGWDRSNSNNGPMETITVTKNSSLWAGRSPWEREPIVAKRPDFTSALIHHIPSDPLTPSSYDPYLPFLHVRSPHPPTTITTTPTTSRYYREDLYPEYDPQQVGTIGENYRQNNTYRRDNSGYGVFVI